MEQITYCGALLFLAILVPEDIKEKQICAKTVIIFGFLALACQFAKGRGNILADIACDLIPGIFLLILSLISKESIGLGDGMAVAVLGLWIGGGKTLMILCIAWMLAGAYAVVRLIRKRKEPIPFVPFLLLGMEVLLLYA